MQLSAAQQPVKTRRGVAQGLTLVASAWLIPLTAGILTPVLPEMSRHFVGLPHVDLMIGLIATAPALMVVLLSLPVGWIADRLGRLPVLITGLICFAGFGAAPYWVDRLDVIFLLRLAVGVALTAVVTVGTAMIGSYFDGVERQRWLAMQAASSNIMGIIIGMTGGLIGGLSWRSPFLVHLGAIPLLIAAATLLPQPIALQVSSSVQKRLSDGVIRFDKGRLLRHCLLTVVASVVLFTAVLQISFLINAQGIIDPAVIGLGVSLASAGAAAGSFLSGGLARVTTPHGRLVLAFLAACCGLVLMSSSSSFTLTVTGAVFAAAGAGIATPTLIVQVVTDAPIAAHSLATGAWISALFLGQFINPPLFLGLTRLTGTLSRSIGLFGISCGLIALTMLVGVARKRIEGSSLPSD